MKAKLFKNISRRHCKIERWKVQIVTKFMVISSTYLLLNCWMLWNIPANFTSTFFYIERYKQWIIQNCDVYCWLSWSVGLHIFNEDVLCLLHPNANFWIVSQIHHFPILHTPWYISYIAWVHFYSSIEVRLLISSYFVLRYNWFFIKL